MASADYILYVFTHYLLSMQYLILTIITSILLSLYIKKHRTVVHYKVIFLIIILIGAASRFVTFIIFTLVYQGYIILSNSFGYLFSVFPSFLFFTAYLILLFQWIIMVFTIRSVTLNRGDPDKIKKFFMILLIIIVFLQYVGLFILVSLSFAHGLQPPSTSSYPGNVYEEIMSFSISIFYTIASLLFLLCGFVLIREFRTNLLVVGTNQAKVRWRMIIIVFIVPSAFLVRVCFVALNVVIDWSAFWWFDWGYYTLFEILPLFTLVVVTSHSSKDTTNSPKREEAPLIVNSSDS